MLKRSSPLIDPYGMPDSTLFQWLNEELILTLWFFDSVIKIAMNRFEISIKTSMECCTLCPLRKPYRNFRIIVENIQLIDRINIVHKFLMKLVKCLMACNWFSKKSDLPLKWEFLLLVVSIRFLILIILRCLENFSM